MFTVRQLPIVADAHWRKKVQPLVEPLAEMAIAAGVSNPMPERLVKLAFTSALFIDPIALLDAICNYAPEIDGEREWVETHAYTDEALAALLSLFFGMTGTPHPNGEAPKVQPTTSPN